MKQELAIRRYNLDGECLRVDKYQGMAMSKLKAFTSALLKMSGLFGHETVAPLNACNISVRGPNGKFVKWK